MLTSSPTLGLVILFIVLQLAIYGDAVSPENSSNNVTMKGNRDEKFLSLFSIVRFANTVCVGTNSYNGTCLTSAECASYGGNSSGTCASGFGVCCIVAYALCGTTTSVNNTYWQNPNYSSAYTTAGQCSMFITKMSSDITQMRLDFVAFTLAQPDSAAITTATQCIIDSFTVSNAANPVPAICGINTNQHIYLDLSPGTSTITLNIITTTTTTSRYWNIRISQIPGGQSYTAPDYCLQWYTEASGTVSSFNFQAAATPLVQHLAYQDYTICIRTNQGFCGIKYAVCSSTYPSYGISGKSDSTAGVGTETVIDAACKLDFLQIPCATDTTNTAINAGGTGCASKICGIFFSSVSAAAASVPVYSYRRPFELRFYTDSSEQVVTSTNEGFGFCLSYSQQPCLSFASTSG